MWPELELEQGHPEHTGSHNGHRLREVFQAEGAEEVKRAQDAALGNETSGRSEEEGPRKSTEKQWLRQLKENRGSVVCHRRQATLFLA